MFKRKQNQILRVKCKVWTRKNISNKDYNLIIQKRQKYLCQSCAGKNVPPSNNKINDSLNNAKIMVILLRIL